jgi:ABC-type uncharacterized transport system involved in gliding motility auxiliary subunit
MEITPKFRRNYRIQNIVFLLLFLNVMGLLAWLSTQHPFMSDWTAGARNSLSADTVRLLKQLEGPVMIRSYQADDATLQQAVNETLGRYQHEKPDLEFRIINPDLDIEMAKADKIEQYGQTVINYKGKSERIDSLSEQNVTNALLRLSRDSRPVVYFLQGHGERDPLNTSPVGYATLATKLQEQGFELRTLNLLKEDVQAGLGTLIIPAPSKPLLPNEAAKIEQFVNDGGHVLWLQDPEPQKELNKLAQAIGIEFIPGVVVDDNPQLRTMLGLTHPAILPIIEYRRHAITEQMKYFTLFTTVAALRSVENSPWETTELLITQKTSWAETDGFILNIEFNAGKDTRGPLSIGLALERNLEKDNTRKQQRVVVIGDSDFASNNNLGHGANLEFLLATINWLSQDDALISIAPKAAPDLQLDLNDTQVAVIGLGFLLVIPLGLLGAGITIWLKRRKR